MVTSSQSVESCKWTSEGLKVSQGKTRVVFGVVFVKGNAIVLEEVLSSPSLNLRKASITIKW